jgi:hypothetical protein
MRNYVDVQTTSSGFRAIYSNENPYEGYDDSVGSEVFAISVVIGFVIFLLII